MLVGLCKAPATFRKLVETVLKSFEKLSLKVQFEVRSFFGICTYYNHYVQGLTTIDKPFTRVME